MQDIGSATPGRVVFEGDIRGKNYLIRYPLPTDAQAMMEFVNEFSAERTFVRLQGEQFTLEEEQHYLTGVLDSIAKRNVVKLLAFSGKHFDRLVGSADVTRLELSEKHLGLFGIVIRQEARGNGLGRKLTELTLAEADAQLSGLEQIILRVYRQNSVARTLYESLGFIEYGCLPGGRKIEAGYDDEILMRLDCRV